MDPIKTFSMPKELMEKWVATLRSGEYKQGHNYLCVEEADHTKSYCCLGVLQMIVDGRVETDANDESCALPSMEWYNRHNICLINPESRTYHVTSDAMYFPSLNEDAAGANDKGKTFAEIADALELHGIPV